MNRTDPRLPVTVLSGFLGAGKTTLLNHASPDLRAQLDACLLTDAEMATRRAGWVKLEDPFPRWEQQHDDAAIETELA